MKKEDIHRYIDSKEFMDGVNKIFDEYLNPQKAKTMYKVIRTWDGHSVLDESGDSIFSGSLADCYAFIKLKEEGYLND